MLHSGCPWTRDERCIEFLYRATEKRDLLTGEDLKGWLKETRCVLSVGGRSEYEENHAQDEIQTSDGSSLLSFQSVPPSRLSLECTDGRPVDQRLDFSKQKCTQDKKQGHSNSFFGVRGRRDGDVLEQQERVPSPLQAGQWIVSHHRPVVAIPNPSRADADARGAPPSCMDQSTTISIDTVSVAPSLSVTVRVTTNVPDAR